MLLSANSASSSIFTAAHCGDEAAVVRLHAGGADIGAKSSHGWTPLWVAAYNGHVGVSMRLVKLGADVEAPNDKGATPLWIAASAGHAPVVHALAQLGARVEAPNADGKTPLHAAAYMGRPEACRELALQQGASLRARDGDGWTALEAAAKRGHVQCLQALADLGAEISPAALELAEGAGHEGAARKLREMTDAAHRVCCAAGRGDTLAVRVLHRRGFGVNRACHVDSRHTMSGFAPSYWDTPLAAAARGGHVPCLEMLAELGALVNHANDRGETALWIAASVGETEAVAALAALGADCTTPDAAGTTPLEAARRVRCGTARDCTTALLHILADAMPVALPAAEVACAGDAGLAAPAACCAVAVAAAAVAVAAPLRGCGSGGSGSGGDSGSSSSDDDDDDDDDDE
jgi:cytohesin